MPDYLRNDSAIFFACIPDPGAVQRIDTLSKRLRSEHRLKGELLPPTRFQVTLHHLGSYRSPPAEILASARQAAAAVLTQPFDLALDRVLTLAGGRRLRPLVLCGAGEGIAGLMALHRALGAGLDSAGLTRDRAAYYTPHITLQIADHLLAERRVEPITWHCAEFALLQRSSGQDYFSVLDRWPLTGESPSSGAAGRIFEDRLAESGNY